ncbi:hypothetical protein D3C80_1486030 [compost metagenome]
MKLEIRRSRSEHNARYSAHGERWNEADSEQIRSRKTHLPAPHRKQPVENFNPRWNSNEHRRYRKQCIRHRTEAGCEHMMRPDHEAQEGDQYGCEDHRAVAE